MIKCRRNKLCALLACVAIGIVLAISVHSTSKTDADLTPVNFKCSNDRDITDSQQATIVLYTPFNGDLDWIHLLGPNQDMTIQGDRGSCVVTTDRTLTTKADAVVFHARDIDFSTIPSHRCPWQNWVFFSFESPVNNGLDDDRWRMANDLLFNLTMSYSPKSDFTWPLGSIIPTDEISFDNRLELEINEKIENFVDSFYRRQHQAIWITDRCSTPSGREHLVHALMKRGISVDIIGRCLNSTNNRAITPEILANYRFYFSFDSSYCDDYISDAFKAMKLSYRYGIVPVVFSGAKLHDYLPDGAYIDASDVDKIDRTASLLKSLSKYNASLTEIASYYSWFRSYKVASSNPEDAFTPLCDKLWTSRSQRQSSGSHNSFYSSRTKNLKSAFGSCTSLNIEK